MNGLKESLEQAIREMQEAPVIEKPEPVRIAEELSGQRADSVVLPDTAPDEAAESLSLEEPPSLTAPPSLEELSSGPRITDFALFEEAKETKSKPPGNTDEAQNRPSAELPASPPSANRRSIEEALTSAPSVSPNYVPPKKPVRPPAPPAVPSGGFAAVPPLEVPQLAPRIASQTPVQPAMEGISANPALKGRGPSVPDNRKMMAGAAVHGVDRSQKIPTGEAGFVAEKKAGARSAIPPVVKQVPGKAAIGKRPELTGTDKKGDDRHGIGDVANSAVDMAKQARNVRDRVWRWATIAVSCAGGLASGWLGSNVSDQMNRVFDTQTRAIVGKASESLNGKGARGMPGLVNNGKGDRATPLDENLCTVLELDRSTGLTLARPCRPVRTSGFTSTLRKDDMVVGPK